MTKIGKSSDRPLLRGPWADLPGVLPFIAHGCRQLRGLGGLPVCLPVSGWGHCARLPAVEGPVRASGVLTGVWLRALRTLTGNGGACEGSRCAYWCRVGRYCARLPAVEGPGMASGVPTGARLRALRTVAGNGSAWDDIRCAYRCLVEGIAHGCWQWIGLG